MGFEKIWQNGSGQRADFKTKKEIFYGLLAIALASVVLIFFLPWQLPPSKVSQSDSYMMGFNNLMALAGVGITLSLLFVWFCKIGIAEHRWGHQLAMLLNPPQVKWWEYLIPTLYAGMQSALTWWWFQTTNYYYFGESGYGISRLDMTLMGEQPYRDFEWNYGPFLLYLPAAIYKALNGWVDSAEAYILGLIVCIFLSLLAIYYLISQLNLTRTQRVVMLLLFGSMFQVALATYGTQLRFLLPFVCLFFIHRQFLQSASIIKKSVWSLGLVCACFAMSPEIGFVFCVAIVAYGVGQMRAGNVRDGLVCLLAPLVLVISIAIFFTPYFDSIFSFAKGSGGIPIFPSAFVILFLLTLFFLVPLLGAYSWKHSTSVGALSLGLGTTMFLLYAPSLGRCDPPHLALNGMGMFIVMVGLMFHQRRWTPIFLTAFVLIFNLSFVLSSWNDYEYRVVSVLRDRAKGATRPRHTVTAFEVANPELIEIRTKLRKYGKVGTPLGIDADAQYVLRQARLYQSEYYPLPFLEINMPSQLDRKLKDVGNMQYVMVSPDQLKLVPIDIKQLEISRSRWMSRLLLYPVKYRVENEPFIPTRRIVSYILTNFQYESKVGCYWIMKRKSTS